MQIKSFGYYPKIEVAEVWPIFWRDQNIPFHQTDKNFLAYAQGKSYGDSCLLQDGILLDTSRMNKFIAWDNRTGVLKVEAGITLAEILQCVVPQGWFLPVLPGTKYISIGGAIANDIHGKNHHQMGTIGRHLSKFEILRSTGERMICSATENTELFNATIGGLGLTGLITWAEISLMSIPSTYLEIETIKFSSSDEFLQLSQDSEKAFLYTVSWIDCSANSKDGVRGIFMRANHADTGGYASYSRRIISIPGYLPNFVLNRMAIKIFNQFYYAKQLDKTSKKLMHYEPFFFQLDALNHWNKIYGKRGFLQYQCILPNDFIVISHFVKKIKQSGQGSFLSVLKSFGHFASPGLLSFPKAGVTFALDFAYQGKNTLTLLDELDAIVLQHNGRVYPAKDARMSAAVFSQYYPNWQYFSKFKDTRFNSSFWRRVTGDS